MWLAHHVVVVVLHGEAYLTHIRAGREYIAVIRSGVQDLLVTVYATETLLLVVVAQTLVAVGLYSFN